MEDLSDPMMLYCIGAAKAGTTWLHHHLNQHPQTKFPHIKEIHYFDSRNLKMPERAMRARFAPGQRLKLLKTPKVYLERRAYANALGAVKGNHQSYRNFMLRGARSARLIADFTPAYATLNADDFRTMDGIFSQTRFLYLLRDPVDRAWSHMRMLYHRHNGDDQIDMAKMDHMLARLIAGKMPYLDDRGSYARTIDNLLRAGLGERLQILFYENLFDQKSIDRICEFVGIDTQPIDTKTRIFAGINSPIPAHIRTSLAAYYQDEYHGVETHCGALPKRWQENIKT